MKKKRKWVKTIPYTPVSYSELEREYNMNKYEEYYIQSPKGMFTEGIFHSCGRRRLPHIEQTYEYYNQSI